MIESITIAKTASYGETPEKLEGLSQFNYMFGSNGSGKTTISRIIADDNDFLTCNVTWKGGTRLEPMVYNQDFLELNFNQTAELKGVFTLGEEQVDTLTKIDKAKAELDSLTTKIETLTHGLQGTDDKGGKIAELKTLEADFKDKCWIQKKKHDAKLKSAFERYRGNSVKFKEKVIYESGSNTSVLLTIEDLEKKAESVFGPTPKTEQVISTVDINKLLAHETNQILKKKVIGKEDVDIAAMIKKLGNSDWVREGLPFYNANDGICPFCQQSTTEAFAHSLNEYFDETFVNDNKTIESLVTEYSTDAYQIQQQLSEIISTPSRFLDVEKLKKEKELIDSKIIINKQRLEGKKKESSKVVELETLNNVTSVIRSLINEANDRISDHNKMVANLSKERSELTSQVWKFVLEELKIDINKYRIEKDSLNKAIESMKAQIAKTKEEKKKKKKKSKNSKNIQLVSSQR